MARELIIKIKCDFCGNSIDEAETKSGEVILDGVVYHLDLCHHDADDLTQKLTPKPKANALPPTPHGHSTPPQQRTVPCEVCGVKCKNERGVRLHMYKMHGVEPASKTSRARGHEGEPLFPQG